MNRLTSSQSSRSPVSPSQTVGQTTPLSLSDIQKARIYLNNILGSVGKKYFAEDAHVAAFLTLLQDKNVQLTDEEKIEPLFLAHCITSEHPKKPSSGAPVKRAHRNHASQDRLLPSGTTPTALKSLPLEEKSKREDNKASRLETLNSAKAKVAASTERAKNAKLRRSAAPLNSKAKASRALSPFELSLPPLIRAIHSNDLDGVKRLLAFSADKKNDLKTLYLGFSRPSDAHLQMLEFSATTFLHHPDHQGDPAIRFLEKGLLKAFPLLLSIGFPDQARYSGVNALTYAVLHGASPAIIELLCNADATLIDSCDGLNETPLTTAITLGNEACVKYLLDSGADISKANGRNQTPIWLALRQKRFDIVEHLALNGADILEGGDISESTPLSIIYDMFLEDDSLSHVLTAFLKNIPKTAYDFFDWRTLDEDYYGAGMKQNFIDLARLIIKIKNNVGGDVELSTQTDACLDEIVLGAERRLNAPKLLKFANLFIDDVSGTNSEAYNSLLRRLLSIMPDLLRRPPGMSAEKFIAVFNDINSTIRKLRKTSILDATPAPTRQLAQDCIRACLLVTADVYSGKAAKDALSLTHHFFPNDFYFKAIVLETLLGRKFDEVKELRDDGISSNLCGIFWNDALAHLSPVGFEQLVANKLANLNKVSSWAGVSLSSKIFALTNRSVGEMGSTNGPLSLTADAFVRSAQMTFAAIRGGLESVLDPFEVANLNLAIVGFYKDLPPDQRRLALAKLDLHDLIMLRDMTKVFGNVSKRSQRLNLIVKHIHEREKHV